MDEGEIVEDDADIRNDEWFKANYVELIQQYPNRWIAVLDQKVVHSGNRRRLVERRAREMAGDRELSFYFVPPSDIMP
ncbi:MAG: hypothetical protein A3K67_07785 [Euryarchaeota archaeon RBG_16_62_10]|nr:MAG: hypothetical protein A3K67_07785 [Euryarchaeota archaeon RBG_16_62_10]